MLALECRKLMGELIEVFDILKEFDGETIPAIREFLKLNLCT